MATINQELLIQFGIDAKPFEGGVKSMDKAFMDFLLEAARRSDDFKKKIAEIAEEMEKTPQEVIAMLKNASKLQAEQRKQDEAYRKQREAEAKVVQAQWDAHQRQIEATQAKLKGVITTAASFAAMGFSIKSAFDFSKNLVGLDAFAKSAGTSLENVLKLRTVIDRHGGNKEGAASIVDNIKNYNRSLRYGMIPNNAPEMGMLGQYNADLLNIRDRNGRFYTNEDRQKQINIALQRMAKARGEDFTDMIQERAGLGGDAATRAALRSKNFSKEMLDATQAAKGEAKTIETMKKSQQVKADFDAQIESIKAQVFEKLLPAITPLMKGFVDFAKHSPELVVGASALGVITLAFAGLVGPIKLLSSLMTPSFMKGLGGALGSSARGCCCCDEGMGGGGRRGKRGGKPPRKGGKLGRLGKGLLGGFGLLNPRSIAAAIGGYLTHKGLQYRQNKSAPSMDDLLGTFAHDYIPGFSSLDNFMSQYGWGQNYEEQEESRRRAYSPVQRNNQDQNSGNAAFRHFFAPISFEGYGSGFLIQHASQIDTSYPHGRVIPTPMSAPMGDKQAYLKKLERQFNLPPGTLDDIWKKESGRGRNTGTSRAGARGDFQFMPGTARRYGVNVNDFYSSARGAAQYMRDLLRMFKGDRQKATAAYNWGEGNVMGAIKKYGDDWMSHAPGETRRYAGNIPGGGSNPMPPMSNPGVFASRHESAIAAAMSMNTNNDNSTTTQINQNTNYITINATDGTAKGIASELGRVLPGVTATNRAQPQVI